MILVGYYEFAKIIGISVDDIIMRSSALGSDHKLNNSRKFINNQKFNHTGVKMKNFERNECEHK